MARHITHLHDIVGDGEVASLVGCPIHDNADMADLTLTSDQWADLVTRRRRVGWPLHFVAAEHCDA